MEKYKTSITKVFKENEFLDNVSITHLLGHDEDAKRYILDLYGVDTSSINLDTADITFKISEKENIVKTTPTINTVYYDKDDQITEHFIKKPEATDLVSFEGEIYENIHFENEEEVNEFLKENNYKDYIYNETTSLMHFKAEEINQDKLKRAKLVELKTKDNSPVLSGTTQSIIEKLYNNTIDTKEIYITKNKDIYSVYFGEPRYFLNKQSGVSFTKEELDHIIDLISTMDSGYFLIYVKAALVAHERTIANRGYKPSSSFLNNETIDTISELLVNHDNINENESIYTKLKIITDTPLKLLDNNILEDNKVYKKCK